MKNKGKYFDIRRFPVRNVELIDDDVNLDYFGNPLPVPNLYCYNGASWVEIPGGGKKRDDTLWRIHLKNNYL